MAAQPTKQESRFNRGACLNKGLDSPQRPSADQVLDLSLVAGVAPGQFAVQAIGSPRALLHELVPVVEDLPKLASSIVNEKPRQVRLASDDASNGERVRRIGLATLAKMLALPNSEERWHFNDALPQLPDVWPAHNRHRPSPRCRRGRPS